MTTCLVLFVHTIDYVISTRFICLWENPTKAHVEQAMTRYLVNQELSEKDLDTLFQTHLLATLDEVFELVEIEQGASYSIPDAIKLILQSTPSI